jgi:hypothetical protein
VVERGTSGECAYAADIKRLARAQTFRASTGLSPSGTIGRSFSGAFGETSYPSPTPCRRSAKCYPHLLCGAGWARLRAVADGGPCHLPLAADGVCQGVTGDQASPRTLAVRAFCRGGEIAGMRWRLLIGAFSPGSSESLAASPSVFGRSRRCVVVRRHSLASASCIAVDVERLYSQVCAKRSGGCWGACLLACASEMSVWLLASSAGQGTKKKPGSTKRANRWLLVVAAASKGVLRYYAAAAQPAQQRD